MREIYDTSGPGKFEGQGPIARYAYEHLDELREEDASQDGLYVALIGKRILTEDEYGFVELLNFGQADRARAIFDIQVTNMEG